MSYLNNYTGNAAAFVRRLFAAVARFSAVLIALVFAGCDQPLGLGEPVDTRPPAITIETPALNKSFGVMVLGDPIYMAGAHSDDVGVTLLRARITNTANQKVYEDVLKTYSVNSDGTWSASVVIPEPGDGGEAEYRLKIIAQDKFKNEGAGEVTVRVDVMAPWVKTAWIDRHPSTGIKQEALREKAYYDELINFDDDFAYRNIDEKNRDDFQNNSFTLKLEVNSNLSGVAATRLFILDENDKILNPGFGMTPSRRPADPKLPEWDINAAILDSLGIGADDRRPRYIHFEVWAWNGAEWGNNSWDAEPPVPARGQEDRAVRKQRIHGTCWYPDSDRPRVSVNNKSAASGFVSLNSSARLSLSVYDDDRLKTIYAGLIPLETYDRWRGNSSDAAFVQALMSDADSSRRDAVISWLNAAAPNGNANLFAPAAGTDNRDSLVELPAGVAGEYRLVTMVLDDKSVYGSAPPPEVWGVNAPVRVEVLDLDKPIIIVENPAENTFPALNNGVEFTLSGYTISVKETTVVEIAWVPDGVDTGGLEAYFTEIAGNDEQYPVNRSGGAYIRGGIHIWKLPVEAAKPYPLNEEIYQQNLFGKTFNILEDFKVNGIIENKFKLFYIYSRNVGTGYSIKPYRLSNYTEPPVVDIFYPTRDLMVHNNEADLVLKMRVNPRSIGIKPGSVKISDITGSGGAEANAGANNHFFEEPSGPVPQANGEYHRTVRVKPELMGGYFREGSRRTYRFEAGDVLGNSIVVERKIIMSNLPALMYITSANVSGTYGQGTELRFEAVFSMPVTVIPGGTPQSPKRPRLKLFFHDPGNTEPASANAYADYVPSPAAANTVIFSCVVPDGVHAPKLYTSLNPIDLNGAKMLSTEASGGDAKIDFFNQDDSLQSKVTIALDGRRPRVVSAGFGQIYPPNGLVWASGNSYFNKGKTVTLELTSDKQVRISGTPKAYLNLGAGGIAEAVFSSVTHSPDGSSSVLRFTYMVADSVNVNETQVSWTNSGGKWISTSSGAVMTKDTEDTITDMYGNFVILPDEAALSPDDCNGNSRKRRAHIITAPLPVPGFVLKRNGAELPSPAVVNGPVDIIVDRNGGPANSRISYSAEGGYDPKTLSGTAGVIHEKDPGNNQASYRPSLYQITVWQEDPAGNCSPQTTPAREVEINSRAPELLDITCGEADGAYRAGEALTFKLSFSRPARLKAGASASLTLTGTRPGYTDSAVISFPPRGTAGEWSTLFTFNWSVAAGLAMMDIKATAIALGGFEDQYGNVLKNYSNTIGGENQNSRPIAPNSSFNLKRDSAESPPKTGLKIDSKGPKIISYSPAAPSSANTMGNGGVINAPNSEIILTFDKPVTAQAGKNIIARPWGNWAVPPVLDTVVFDNLYNSAFYHVDRYDNTIGGVLNSEPNFADAGEYRKRLQWRDGNGLPEAPYNVSDNYVTGKGAVEYNYYIYTTKGLNAPSNTRVRPDTEGKWVLAFRHDLYDGVDRLREVFNAAHWKWRIIPSTDTRVRISGNTVTVDLDGLEPGRIWELIMDRGAFRDDAGNDSEEIKSSVRAASGEQSYRFWSPGTEVPVIRVDRYSHGDHYKGVFDPNLNGYGETVRPKIDTRIRIDCETPGASINYDTVRTSYTLAAAGTGPDSSEVFSTTTKNTAAAFFNHFNSGKDGNGNSGYSNNTFGNGGSNNSQAAIPRDADNYCASLLVPNYSETPEVSANDLETDNGAVRWSALEPKGAALKSGGGREYKNIDSSGSVIKGPYVFTHTDAYTGKEGYFFYAGDAHENAYMNARDASGDRDSRLFTGRRDYIAAAARKKAVNTGVYSGPALAVSEPSYEGVYKTTWVFREPQVTRLNGWIVLQGFDTPVVSRIPGFPLNEATFSSPPGTGEKMAYFSKQAWRVDSANYLWVSWDIVCDWYQKGRGWKNGKSVSMQRDGYNHGAVLSTYGGITYRYNQLYN